MDPWLVNARDVKHLPGRPKTDKLDAVWLCKVAERQMIRPSFVPPPPFRKLRDLTRYRAGLVAARTAEKNRVEKLLEDAQIKLSVVVSDIFGASGRDMLAALVAGQRNPKVLAQLARRSMRKKITVLEEAFTGYFTDHHAFLLGRMLTRVDAIADDITALDARIEEQIAPFTAAVRKLDEVPGISLAAAHAIIAEIGLDMARFPTAGHLVSWAKLSPRTIQSGAKQRGGKTGKGNPYLKGVLGEAAIAAAKTDTFLGERYRRLVKRRGKLKALVAVARSILVIVWHLLTDPTIRFRDLGPDFHARRVTTDRKIRSLVPLTRSPRPHRHPATRRLNQPANTPARTIDRIPGRCRTPPTRRGHRCFPVRWDVIGHGSSFLRGACPTAVPAVPCRAVPPVLYGRARAIHRVLQNEG